MRTPPWARGILFAAPLVAVLSSLELGLRYGAERHFGGQVGKVSQVMQHRIDPELAIFGASNALMGFDAPLIEKMTGLKTFNFAKDGTYFVQYQALVREFAAYARKPRIVVFAETYLTFVPTHALRNPGDYLPYFSSPNIYEVFRDIDSELTWKLRYIPYYSFVVADVEYYSASLRGYRELLGKPAIENERQGFFPRGGGWHENGSPSQLPPLNAAGSDRVAGQFAELVSRFERKGTPVVVVVMPVDRECRSAVPDFDARKRRLSAMLGDRGTFLDYSDHPMASDRANFYDCGHLNARGAERFSEAFANDLTAIK